MINQERWVRSLPGAKKQTENIINQVDHTKWINTIPSKKKIIIM